MTPLMIEILLRAYYSPDLHEASQSEAGQAAVAHFQEMRMMDGLGRLTERGRAHVSQLCRLPYPRNGWVSHSGDLIPEGAILMTTNTDFLSDGTGSRVSAASELSEVETPCVTTLLYEAGAITQEGSR